MSSIICSNNFTLYHVLYHFSDNCIDIAIRYTTMAGNAPEIIGYYMETIEYSRKGYVVILSVKILFKDICYGQLRTITA